MIPVTYPSSLSYRTTRQMVAYPITDLTGKRRWTDYIPVKFVDQTTFTVENSHNNNAYISVDMLSSNANLKEGIDYIPVYIDNAATDAWQVSATGYIPVGYSGAALSLQFAGSTFLDSRITFTRASSGTYFDNTGVLRRANRNLLTYSEQFDNATWAKTNSSVTANSTVAPDGAQTADTLVEDTATSTHFTQQTGISATSGVAYTFSIYAKPAGRNWLVLRVLGAAFTDSAAFFDITNVTTGVVAAGMTASISSVGNGWVRCAVRVTATATSTGNVRLNLASANNVTSYTGDGTSGIYIWGAQLEEGSTATQYAKTVASTSGAPRFDHDPVTKAPRGLLIEEQRTNLLLRSEEFDNATWVKINSSATANAAIAPDGTLTAEKLVENTATASHSFQQSVSVTSGTSYTLTSYGKASERGWLVLRVLTAFADSTAYFNLSNGTVGVTGGLTTSITNMGNGWYRCSITATATSTAAGDFRIGVASADNTQSYTGDGTSGIYIWGAQLEAGSFATSYIPTVAAQVTRSADSASMTGSNFSSWYRQDEGTLFAEASTTAAIVTNNLGIFGVSDGTTNERIQLRRNAGGLFVSFLAVDNSVIQYTDSGTLVFGGSAKMALAYKTNDFIGASNGSLGVADTSGTLPTPSQAEIGFGQGITQLNGHIRKLCFYPSRLTNGQLQALTA